MLKIGIIGGSGVGAPDILENVVKIKQHTPYGATSDLITVGTFKSIPVVLISRHGDNHKIAPSLVNYRANIWAMKELGVTHILAPTAVGSLQKHIAPGDFVFPDQFIDRTTKRSSTFYEGSQICHIPMAEPFCPNLRKLLSDSATALKLPHHSKGTVVTIEGPRFSTKAESHMFRLLGGDVINMTTVPEVVLAREAGVCYAAIAMSTDYDCWHESETPVTLDMVLSTMKKNAENVKKLLLDVIPKIADVPCKCHDDIKTSVL
ncbi:S-methyl-5'-thioadenosine phosphorylase [Candidatus Woesearchaeota archaeon]|nr:S-methyl-5'-thioadenosine phosphorylase [Candidatus Woesearchaeota archaeon]